MLRRQRAGLEVVQLHDVALPAAPVAHGHDGDLRAVGHIQLLVVRRIEKHHAHIVPFDGRGQIGALQRRVVVRTRRGHPDVVFGRKPVHLLDDGGVKGVGQLGGDDQHRVAGRRDRAAKIILQRCRRGQHILHGGMGETGGFAVEDHGHRGLGHPGDLRNVLHRRSFSAHSPSYCVTELPLSRSSVSLRPKNRLSGITARFGIVPQNIGSVKHSFYNQEKLSAIKNYSNILLIFCARTVCIFSTNPLPVPCANHLFVKIMTRISAIYVKIILTSPTKCGTLTLH